MSIETSGSENSKSDTDMIRLSIPIDRGTNDQFTNIMPRGLKSQVIRCLVNLVLKEQRALGKEAYLIHHLIKGECRLIIAK